MKKNKAVRRHIAVRQELKVRVEMRLALARSLAQRTRMMIARLDRQIHSCRRPATVVAAPTTTRRAS